MLGRSRVRPRGRIHVQNYRSKQSCSRICDSLFQDDTLIFLGKGMQQTSLIRYLTDGSAKENARRVEIIIITSAYDSLA